MRRDYETSRGRLFDATEAAWARAEHPRGGTARGKGARLRDSEPRPGRPRMVNCTIPRPAPHDWQPIEATRALHAP